MKKLRERKQRSDRGYWVGEDIPSPMLLMALIILVYIAILAIFT